MTDFLNMLTSIYFKTSKQQLHFRPAQGRSKYSCKIKNIWKSIHTLTIILKLAYIFTMTLKNFQNHAWLLLIISHNHILFVKKLPDINYYFQKKITNKVNFQFTSLCYSNQMNIWCVILWDRCYVNNFLKVFLVDSSEYKN